MRYNSMDGYYALAFAILGREQKGYTKYPSISESVSMFYGIRKEDSIKNEKTEAKNEYCQYSLF